MGTRTPSARPNTTSGFRSAGRRVRDNISSSATGLTRRGWWREAMENRNRSLRMHWMRLTAAFSSRIRTIRLPRSHRLQLRPGRHQSPSRLDRQLPPLRLARDCKRARKFFCTCPERWEVDHRERSERRSGGGLGPPRAVALNPPPRLALLAELPLKGEVCPSVSQLCWTIRIA